MHLDSHCVSCSTTIGVLIVGKKCRTFSFISLHGPCPPFGVVERGAIYINAQDLELLNPFACNSACHTRSQSV
jgi:hypothetical protein